MLRRSTDPGKLSYIMVNNIDHGNDAQIVDNVIGSPLLRVLPHVNFSLSLSLVSPLLSSLLPRKTAIRANYSMPFPFTGSCLEQCCVQPSRFVNAAISYNSSKSMI